MVHLRRGEAVSDLLLTDTRPGYDVCGVHIAAVTRLTAAEQIVAAAVRGGPFEVHLCNAYTLSLVDRDARLASALGQADLNLPDGAPIAWVGRRLGTHGPVRGSALLEDVARIGTGRGLRH